jgi:hypothetical protein
MYLLPLLMQIPPTPTDFPIGNPANVPVDLPDYALWDFAPLAVQRWNQVPDFITVSFQALLLLVIVFVGYKLLINFLRSLSNEAVPTDE